MNPQMMNMPMNNMAAMNMMMPGGGIQGGMPGGGVCQGVCQVA